MKNVCVYVRSSCSGKGQMQSTYTLTATVLRDDYAPPEAKVEAEPEPSGDDEDDYDDLDEEDEFDDLDADDKPTKPQGETKPSSKRSDSRDKDLNRNMVVAKIDELSVTKLAHMIDKRGASGKFVLCSCTWGFQQAASSPLALLLGVLVILEDDLSTVSKEQIQQWKKLERFMISRSWDVPIYFTISSTEIENVHASMRSDLLSGSVGDRYHVRVSGSEASVVPSVTVSNLQVQKTEHGKICIKCWKGKISCNIC